MKMLQDSLQDLLNQNEEEKEPIMSEMAAADYEQMQSPIIPSNTPQEQVFSAPKLEDVLPPKQQPEMDQTQQPQVPMVADASEEMAPKKPETEIERLERMLSEARKTDRMLKIGGAVGDALATYINAQSQKKAKIPGVQVQQGAGLGKIAEMFETAPEIQSDIKARREALLKEYELLAKSKKYDMTPYQQEMINLKRQELKADANKQLQAQAEKPTIGEETVDREFAKKYNEWRTGGKADYEENKKIFDEAINALEKGKVTTGTTSGVGARLPGVRTDTRELETRVRKAVNGMLRATLGAQFTEEEGKRIFEQTFDPFSSPEQNIKNMQTELSRIENRAKDIESQGKYFTKQKTLSGFESQETPLETPKKRREIRQGDNIFDADTKEFIRKANP